MDKLALDKIRADLNSPVNERFVTAISIVRLAKAVHFLLDTVEDQAKEIEKLKQVVY